MNQSSVPGEGEELCPALRSRGGTFGIFLGEIVRHHRGQRPRWPSPGRGWGAPNEPPRWGKRWAGCGSCPPGTVGCEPGGALSPAAPRAGKRSLSQKPLAGFGFTPDPSREQRVSSALTGAKSAPQHPKTIPCITPQGLFPPHFPCFPDSQGHPAQTQSH